MTTRACRSCLGDGKCRCSACRALETAGTCGYCGGCGYDSQWLRANAERLLEIEAEARKVIDLPLMAPMGGLDRLEELLSTPEAGR